MKKHNNQNSYDYFQIQSIQNKIVSNSRGGENIKAKEKPIDKIKEKQVKQINKEYFPQMKLDVYDSSMDSSQTTKMKNNNTGRSFGFRPKSSRKSGSMSDRSTKKSLKSLQNEISNLTNELYSKQKALARKNCFDRIKQSQMVQLYRIISFYEGKIEQLEHQIKRYEEVLQKIGRDCDERSKHKSQVEQLVCLYEQMRKTNERLGGQLGQKNYTIGELENKNHKLQMKINFANSKSNFLKQTKSNLSKQSSVQKSLSVPHQIMNSAIAGIKSSQKNYGNIQSKINKIESSLAFLKKQNKNLQSELDKKEHQIFELAKRLQLKDQSKQLKGEEKIEIKKYEMQPHDSEAISEIKNEKMDELHIIKQTVMQIQQNISTKIASSQSYKGIDPLNQVTVLPNKIFAEQQLSQMNPHQSAQLSQRSKQSEMGEEDLVIKYKYRISTQIFKKLRFQLITEEVSHQQFVNLLIGSSLQPQILQQSPYNLNTSEAQNLYEWLSQLKQECFQHSFELSSILCKIIPKFTNLTIRKENDLKIQICNEAFNRENQFNDFVHHNEFISNQDMENYFKNWGLGQSHLDIIGKSYYQETGKINAVQLAQLKAIIQGWALK